MFMSSLHCILFLSFMFMITFLRSSQMSPLLSTIISALLFFCALGSAKSDLDPANYSNVYVRPATVASLKPIPGHSLRPSS